MDKKKRIKHSILCEIIDYLTFDDYFNLLHMDSLNSKIREKIEFLMMNKYNHSLMTNEEKLEIGIVDNNPVPKKQRKRNLFEYKFYSSCFLMDKLTYGLLYYNILPTLSSSDYYLFFDIGVIERYCSLVSSQINLKTKKYNLSKLIPNIENIRNNLFEYLIELIKDNKVNFPYIIDLTEYTIDDSCSIFLSLLIKENLISELNLSCTNFKSEDGIIRILNHLSYCNDFFTLNITNTEPLKEKCISKIKETLKAPNNLKVRILTSLNLGYQGIGDIKKGKINKLNNLLYDNPLASTSKVTTKKASQIIKKAKRDEITFK